MLRQLIVSDYHERVAMRMDIPTELRHALKTQERAPAFFDRLVLEIEKIEKARMRTGRVFRMDRQKLKSLVYDMTDFFINNVKTTADEKGKSEIAQMMIKEKSREEFVLDNNGNGVVKDLGVEVTDDFQEA